MSDITEIEKDRVWNSFDSDKELICPICDEESFRYVPIGRETKIDTIGSVRICSTEYGAFFHGNG